VQKSLTVRSNLPLAGLLSFMFALRFIGSHSIHWIPITLMAVAGVAIGLLAGRAILLSRSALLGAESESEVNAILRDSSGRAMALLGSVSVIGVAVIALKYRDPFFWTAFTAFFALATAYFGTRFLAIYRLNRGVSGRGAQPAA
jgi:hypothetical protein